MVRLSQESDRLPQNSTDSFLKYLPEESSYRMIHTYNSYANEYGVLVQSCTFTIIVKTPLVLNSECPRIIHPNHFVGFST